MTDRDHPLPFTRQVDFGGISRGLLYDLAEPVSAADLARMHRIDLA